MTFKQNITKKIIFKIIKEKFIHDVPFLQLLGAKVVTFDYPNVVLELKWKNDLVGNVIQQSLHGGVTATVLDSIGSLVAVSHFISNESNLTADYLKTELATWVLLISVRIICYQVEEISFLQQGLLKEQEKELQFVE